MFRESSICIIPELGLGCFGCCGHNFKKSEIIDSVKKNNLELQKMNFDDLSIRMSCRRRKELRASGICPNIINDNGKFLCGVHPSRTGCEDPRIGYCDTHFLCKLAFHFNEMNSKEKKKLFEFLKEKVSNGMDSLDFSLLNSEDKLWEEYQRK